MQRTADELAEPVAPPPEGCAERWAYDYVTTTRLAHKLAPPPLPDEWLRASAPLSLEAPGRPPELRVDWAKVKTPSARALRDPGRRAQLLHTFWHHELQAAELMCRAVLAFPDAPLAFKRGLLQLALDEVRHMGLYAEHMERLGYGVGAFTVRDWFWRRAPAARSPRQFVALMGLGFESGNLDHTRRFAERFRAAGDLRGAKLQERVGEEEIPHVAFGAHWFVRLGGRMDMESWARALPPPLSPMVMRGRPLNRAARQAAGWPAPFLDELEAWRPVARGS